jgi:hypothetical protein
VPQFRLSGPSENGMSTLSSQSLTPSSDSTGMVLMCAGGRVKSLKRMTISKFFRQGGWSFLDTESDDEGSEEEEESAFEMSEEDFASEASSEEESDFDDDASAEASDEEVSEDEEGEDWDEMEKKAARKDRDGGLDDEERKPKSKGKAPPSKGRR